MEPFIGPILPTGHILPPVQGNPKKKRGTPFRLPDSPENDSEQPQTPSQPSPSSETHDLPIGPARFDEAGQRINTTA